MYSIAIAASMGNSGGHRHPVKVFSVSDVSETKMRLLVVEDEFLSALSIRYALENGPFEIVAEVGSADEALAMAEQMQPDLVLMDIRLSGDRDGVDAALEIYRRFGLRCLFATANVDAQTRQRAEPANPLGWLTKPYSDAQLERSLEAARGQLK